VGYRYGFKTEASDLAREIRAELSIGSLEQLDPRLLAAHLEIPIVGLSELVASTPSAAHLINVEPEAFSAVTVFDGKRRAIVHNDGHALVRQNSNLAHELAHGLLLHPPTPAMDDKGCRIWNGDIEDEAAWLAGCLLVTMEAALAVARGQLTMIAAANHLGISVDMVRYRVNVTGAQKIVQRAAAARKAG
jgi:Zn-dependent peptidase ImmA (M78 family)